MKVINSRKDLCDMVGQQILRATDSQRLSNVMLLWSTHTEKQLLDQQVDFDIVYQRLFDLTFCIHQKLNKNASVRINLAMRDVRVTTVAAETLKHYIF